MSTPVSRPRRAHRQTAETTSQHQVRGAASLQLPTTPRQPGARAHPCSSEGEEGTPAHPSAQGKRLRLGVAAQSSRPRGHQHKHRGKDDAPAGPGSGARGPALGAPAGGPSWAKALETKASPTPGPCSGSGAACPLTTVSSVRVSRRSARLQKEVTRDRTESGK